MSRWDRDRMTESRCVRLWRWSRVVQGAAMAAGLVVLAVSSVAAAGPGRELAQEATPSIGPLLLAVLVGTIAVERAIELGWNYIEWLLIRLFRWRPGDLKTPGYFQFKSGTSLLAGLLLGVLVANYSGLRLLGYLAPLAPTLLGSIPGAWDILLSGVVIGAGIKPVHDLLGILTHLKNFTAGSALRQREQAGAALAAGILSLHQAGSSGYSVDVPGLGATRVGAGGRARSTEDGDEAGHEARLERYAEIIHENLYLGS